MLENKIIAIIPARGGSKRLRYKNTYPLFGKPLIIWTIEAALKSKYINRDNLYVSSESKRVKDVVGDRCNLIDRPKYLSKDTVWTQEVINHSIDFLKNISDEDILVILQANSPQITTEIIDRSIDKLIKENLWQIHTVDKNLVNNGAIHIMRAKVRNHKGKPNYNGVIITDWIDVHYKEDIDKLKGIIYENRK